MELENNSRPLTTINTIRGLYQYTCLLFRVTFAPEKFLQLMENMPRIVLNCSYFLGDVLIYGGEIDDEHLAQVEKSFENFVTQTFDCDLTRVY